MNNIKMKELTKKQAMECAKQKVYGGTYVDAIRDAFEDDYTSEEFRAAVKAIKKCERRAAGSKLAKEARAEAFGEEI